MPILPIMSNSLSSLTVREGITSAAYVEASTKFKICIFRFNSRKITSIFLLT